MKIKTFQESKIPVVNKYKIVETDSKENNFNHFSVTGNLRQEPYNYTELKQFSYMLFYCITRQIRGNPSYLTDINVLRDSPELDIKMNELILTDLTHVLADECARDVNEIDLWNWFRLFLYPELAPQCDTITQQNILMKFLHVSIKTLINNYNFADYVKFGSIFAHKNVNVTYSDFYDSVQQLTMDAQFMAFFQVIMKQAYQPFCQWYRQHKDFKFGDSQNQYLNIEEQLNNVQI